MNPRKGSLANADSVPGGRSQFVFITDGYHCIPGQPPYGIEITITKIWIKVLLTHWGRVTHICVVKLTTIGSLTHWGRVAHICFVKLTTIGSKTHWGRVANICVFKLTTIGSDNGLSPGRRQAVIWTNAGILLIGPLGTNFIEILIGIQTFSFKKMHLKMSSAKWRPFYIGLNVLIKNPVHTIFMYHCLPLHMYHDSNDKNMTKSDINEDWLNAEKNIFKWLVTK